MNAEDSQELNLNLPTGMSRMRRILRRLGWVAFTLLCLIVFTLFKLPDERIKAYIDSQINAQLAPHGMSLTAKTGTLSFLLGVTYRMGDVTLRLPLPSPSVHVDSIKVSPSLFAFILGKTVVDLEVVDGKKDLNLTYSQRDTQLDIRFHSNQMDLGKLAIFPLLTGTQASGILDGKGHFSGDLHIPNTFEGDVSLQIQSWNMDPQRIAGFSLPRLQLSDTVAQVTFENGKAIIKNFRLGKPGNASDDLSGTVTGDVTLGKDWRSSQLNLKAKFSVSDSLKRSFVLLDALLGSGKQPDGSYRFQITGPATSPAPAPLAEGG